ncbi:hypothetical protein V2J09_019404 [Rumex salicifolius]
MSWPTRRPEGSSPLHNFSLPPSLKWGAQKVLRCAKSHSLRRSAAAAASHSADDTEALRGKLMRDLRTPATTSPVLDEEDEDDESAAARPWNLRTRRAACRAPGDCVSAGGGDRNREASLSPMTLEKGSRRIRDSEKRGRAKFSIELSKEEVELDYLVMLGNRPPRRPKKRPKMVQRQLEFVFPGLWLTEITIDRYKVPDCVELVKT